MPSVLLVARFDDHRHSHAALQQRALERLGAAVTTLNLEKTGWLGRLTRQDLAPRLEQALRHAAPDLVLVTDGEVLREGAVEVLKPASRARWVHWFLEPEQAAVHLEHAVRVSDQVCVAGTHLAKYWSERTGKSIVSLDAGCDPSVHRPLRVKDPFRANVVFAGTASPYRVGVLEQLVEFGLAVWGPGWKKTPLREYCRGDLLSAENFVRAYAGGSVAINLHREPDSGGPDGSCHRRVFEVAAIGTAQIVDPRQDLAGHFALDQEVVTWHSIEELRDKVRRLLAHTSERERLGQAARRTAMHRHTYMHRLRGLVGTEGTGGG